MHCTARSSNLVCRLRTVVEADLILVFNHGEVVEQGTHQELLEKGGLYYNMWIEQAYTSSESESEADTDADKTEGRTNVVEVESEAKSPH